MATMIFRRNGRFKYVLPTVWWRSEWVSRDGFELRLSHLAASYTFHCTAATHDHYHCQIMVMFQNDININSFNSFNSFNILISI